MKMDSPFWVKSSFLDVLIIYENQYICTFHLIFFFPLLLLFFFLLFLFMIWKYLSKLELEQVNLKTSDTVNQKNVGEEWQKIMMQNTRHNGWYNRVNITIYGWLELMQLNVIATRSKGCDLFQNQVGVITWDKFISGWKYAQLCNYGQVQDQKKPEKV